MTGPDYPAAHSMDTVWFAVDAAGHVAAFYTGENGSCPEGAKELDLMLDLYRRTVGPADAEDIDTFATVQALGVYVYEYENDRPAEGLVERYRRTVAAAPRLHADQLPPDLRQEWKRYRFPGVLFPEAEYLQPFEFFECYAHDVDAEGYLSADGTVVRPVRGREHAWDGFVATVRHQAPDLAARLRFEGPADGK